MLSWRSKNHRPIQGELKTSDRSAEMQANSDLCKPQNLMNQIHHEMKRYQLLTYQTQPRKKILPTEVAEPNNNTETQQQTEAKY